VDFSKSYILTSDSYFACMNMKAAIKEVVEKKKLRKKATSTRQKMLRGRKDPQAIEYVSARRGNDAKESI
jgi:hypothetical protein